MMSSLRRLSKRVLATIQDLPTYEEFTNRFQDVKKFKIFIHFRLHLLVHHGLPPGLLLQLLLYYE